MKRISRNLGFHRNGTYYLDIKRDGRQIRHSLGTKNQREAKRRLKVELAKLNAGPAIAKADASLTEPPASKDRYLTQKNKALRLCKDWDKFDPSILWSAVQGELKANPRKRAAGLTHAPNCGASSLNQLVHYCGISARG